MGNLGFTEIMLILVVVLIYLFPQLVLWLPSLM